MLGFHFAATCLRAPFLPGVHDRMRLTPGFTSISHYRSHPPPTLFLAHPPLPPPPCAIGTVDANPVAGRATR